MVSEASERRQAGWRSAARDRAELKRKKTGVRAAKILCRCDFYSPAVAPAAAAAAGAFDAFVVGRTASRKKPAAMARVAPLLALFCRFARSSPPSPPPRHEPPPPPQNPLTTFIFLPLARVAACTKRTSTTPHNKCGPVVARVMTPSRHTLGGRRRADGVRRAPVAHDPGGRAGRQLRLHHQRLLHGDAEKFRAKPRRRSTITSSSGTRRSSRGRTFRGKVLGATDRRRREAGSLRGRSSPTGSNWAYRASRMWAITACTRRRVP